VANLGTSALPSMGLSRSSTMSSIGTSGVGSGATSSGNATNGNASGSTSNGTHYVLGSCSRTSATHLWLPSHVSFGYGGSSFLLRKASAVAGLGSPKV
jgi:hypothetical protein